MAIKKDEGFSSWQITVALLRKTKKKQLQEKRSQFKHLSIKFKHFSSGGTLPTKSLQNKPLLWKERIVSGSVMILMDLNEHISLVHEEMKFKIRENTGSFWGKLEMKY